ncbi:hypothetical protein L1987_48562 [Smallanthus sonchifolius]|uniref:Uncharacterized protein n=1 Tax=Smallanthus sonchifolius TaxID=185202 RepID=A0ACB9FT70_9ASTR|nr:hypothetical protein L1987_48562 [Smallanthus sonchifolius]
MENSLRAQRSPDMATETIASIRPGRSGAIIEVRVIRKWVFSSRPDEPWYLFVDRNGDAIQDFAAKIDKDNIDARLSMMPCYQIDSYVCRATRPGMRTVRHDATLKIGKATTIIPVNDNESILHYYFEFQPYAALNNRINDNSVLTDYIGTVESKFDGTTTHNDPYLRVIFRNERDHIGVLPSTSSQAHQLTAAPTVQTEITLVVLAQKEISDLSGSTFVCDASITQFAEGMPCLYAACPTCQMTIDRSDDKWACATDGITETPKYMFRLFTTIDDDTGTTNVTIFDKIAKQLLEKDAYDMVIKEGYDILQVIPPPILLLRGQTKKFHLRGPQHRRYRCIIFTVSKLSDVTIHEQEKLLKSTLETPKSSDLQCKTQETPANSSFLSEKTDSGCKPSQK